MGLLSRPEEVPALLRLKLAAGRIRRQIPPQEHWAFAYHMLQRVSRSFALVVQQLGTDLRNAVCIFYLVLRALDIVEDDTAIPNKVKLPILRDFYRHIYNLDWLFSCGENYYRVLMDNFRQVSMAFLELGERGLVKEHNDSFNYFITKGMENIVKAKAAMMEITRSFDQPRPASVFGPFSLAPDLAHCSFDHTLRCEAFEYKRLLLDYNSEHDQQVPPARGKDTMPRKRKGDGDGIDEVPSKKPKRPPPRNRASPSSLLVACKDMNDERKVAIYEMDFTSLRNIKCDHLFNGLSVWLADMYNPHSREVSYQGRVGFRLMRNMCIVLWSCHVEGMMFLTTFLPKLILS
uniref:Uncharacterized protein n=1 Tax=Triticum aestivum TaxID=4565 RepID=A0A077S4H9_WHEAT|nr:unnamed protein product [Triticum aestivum]